MTSISPVFLRTSSLMSSDQLMSQLRQTQSQLLDAQRQIATGERYSKPSDAPDKTSAILFLKQQLAAREQYGQNLQHALTVLNNVDATLGEANDVLLEAKTVAMSQIGVGSNADTRATTSLVIDAQLDALLNLANQKFNDIALFGGHAGAPAGGQVFEEFLGGVRYRGSTTNLKADTGAAAAQPFTSNGLDAFGALSARVKSNVDLDPSATAATLIADTDGATGEGFRPGSVNLDVNGIDYLVDLTGADTLGDVVTRINDAINTASPGAGTLAVSPNGFTLTATAGNSIDISDMEAGKTAGDLGIRMGSISGTPTAGADINVRLTARTDLATALGPAYDWSSGLLITQGEQTKVADFSSAETVQDLQNVITDLGLGLRLEINAAGTGLDLVSEVSGIELSVGENGGGSTAADLGLRTLMQDTLLADFRHGLGVEVQTGEPDFRVSLHNGTTFDVNLDGAATVGEVMTAIQAAATAAGVAAADFSVGMASTGNGIVMADNTAGASDFRVQNLGQSLAADHLGLKQNAGAGATLTSTDEAKVKVNSVFTHLIELRDALLNNNERGITLAGSRLETDLDNLARAQATAGVEANRVQQEQSRSEERELAEKTMLSEIQDADLTEVITKFTQLQQQLTAALQVGAQNLQMSLLDFLR